MPITKQHLLLYQVPITARWTEPWWYGTYSLIHGHSIFFPKLLHRLLYKKAQSQSRPACRWMKIKVPPASKIDICFLNNWLDTYWLGSLVYMSIKASLFEQQTRFITGLALKVPSGGKLRWTLVSYQKGVVFILTLINDHCVSNYRFLPVVSLRAFGVIFT